MRLIGGFILHTFANLVALYAATQLVPGFIFTGDFLALLEAAAILALLNAILRPLLRLLFGPLILLTLGLFTIIVNAVMLYLLDILIQPLTIQGYAPLLYATLIIGGVNLIVGFGAKIFSRR